MWHRPEVTQKLRHWMFSNMASVLSSFVNIGEFTGCLCSPETCVWQIRHQRMWLTSDILTILQMGSAAEKVVFCTCSFSGVLEPHCRIGTLLCDPPPGKSFLNPDLPDKTKREEVVFPVSLTIKAFIQNAGNMGRHVWPSSNVRLTYWAIKHSFKCSLLCFSTHWNIRLLLHHYTTLF